MNQELRNNKAIIRDFMRQSYTDDRLAQLLDHARSGKLSYVSCCCFIGIVTADHELIGKGALCPTGSRHIIMSRTFDWNRAEHAFLQLWHGGLGDQDAIRIRRLVPIVKAEIRRRMRLQFAAEVEAVERVGVTQ